MSALLDEAEQAIGGDEAAGDDSGQGSKGGGLKPRLKLVLLIGVPLVILLAAGAVVTWYFGLLGGGPSNEAEISAASPTLVYYDLPEMVVNLRSTDSRAQYLKLKVSLEAHDNDVIEALEPVLPRVLDVFQVYLRELRAADLDGSAGVFRLKEELLRRINMAVHPHKVDKILFKEIIVQ